MKKRWLALTLGLLPLVFSGVASAQAPAPADTVYLVSEDVDNKVFLVDVAGITTPGDGMKQSIVYRIRDDGWGAVENWQIRCADLGTKIGGHHDYQRYPDGSWGDADHPDDSELTFIAASTKTSAGQVADFVCRWPNAKNDGPLPGVPADPTQRIETFITAWQGGLKK